MRRTILASLIALGAPAFGSGDEPIPTRMQRSAEIRLADRNVILPIVMVHEFPFLAGSIAGVPGKLMLDTGIEQALTVNDHRIPVEGGRTVGTGHFGSGQTFSVRLVPELRDIRIDRLRYSRATIVQVQDARLLEEITPDFIGWFGHDAWAGNHALKLDYDNLRAIFETGTAARYLKGERVVAALPFQTRKLPNQPLMPGRIGDLAVVTAWDTGQYGTLYTSRANKERLLKDGRLIPSRRKPGSFDLHGLRLDGHVMPAIRDIDVEEGPFAAAAPIGIDESDILTMGYGFLRQYKTVWDYRSQRIYLLARQASPRRSDRRASGSPGVRAHRCEGRDLIEAPQGDRDERPVLADG